MSCGLAFEPGLTGGTWLKGPSTASILEADGLAENLPCGVLHRLPPTQNSRPRPMNPDSDSSRTKYVDYIEFPKGICLQ